MVKLEMDSDTGKWLNDFAAAVRARDYSAGSRLFDEQVVSFGTVSRRSTGIAQLRQQQWQAVWERTEDFDFEFAQSLHWQEGGLEVVVSGWTSLGVLPDGTRHRREGRATIVLSRVGTELKATHTHFSMAPGSIA